MTPQQVAGLTVVLGDHNIQQVGESQTHESKAARVVRHKGFSQETLVSWRICRSFTYDFCRGVPIE